jgi:hypothetical protein
LKHEITAQVETVTPTQAGRWISGQVENRPLMRSHVSFLAFQIRAGKWGINGQPIIVSSDGRLLDGQHRCYAVIEAERSIETLVVRGVDPLQFATIDTGVVRTAGHVLAIRGRKYYTNVASVLKLLANYRDGHFTGRAARVTNLRILDLDSTNEGIEESVAWSFPGNKLGFRVAVLAFAHYFCTQTRDDAQTFYDAVLDPTGLPPGHPVKALRSRVMRAKRDDERTTAPEQLASIVLAWNAWLKGREDLKPSELRWRRRDPSSGRLQKHPRFVLRKR